jgi:transitional endoplasmic reticulum ATPase
VTKADFETALSETRASVTPEMLEEYQRIQQTLKSDAVDPTGIGFVLPGMLRSRSDRGVESAPAEPAPEPRQRHE